MAPNRENFDPVVRNASGASLPDASLPDQKADKLAAGKTIRAIRRLVARFNATRSEAEKILRQLNELSGRISQQAQSRRPDPAARTELYDLQPA